MRTIYIDLDYKCHSVNDGTMVAIETDYFDDKCDAFIEGYRFVPAEQSWTREDGIEFHGKMISQWRDCAELDRIQEEYEKQLIKQYEAELMELDAALLEVQYQNLIGGI